ncbi:MULTISPECIES: helix-turn-helix domain-containing protein [Trueperella]|uniref:Excisionase family DNA binding protein n=1 Tax=Trueperella abortisuis TaxID=445930 RepID=A0ABT9PK74_9ACTO|nr:MULTISPECIES: helix-turn-helix domain-containing protein [Trueperella]MCI7304743.1 helix-turn-helix domain-containing protein [Trueperella sp.]MDP9833124.1 excisionase family DNA binding protein [Trueperella abortisuis]MDY5404516.1 helix-turn-helix domain-containing protein [Trueperella sp.]
MAQFPPSEPQFVTVAEVADLARVSRMTVYRMIHSGELPAVRVGGSYRVPKSAVDALLSGGMDQAQSRGA